MNIPPERSMMNAILSVIFFCKLVFFSVVFFFNIKIFQIYKLELTFKFQGHWVKELLVYMTN